MSDLLCSLVTMATDAIRRGAAKSPEDIRAQFAAMGVNLDLESAGVVYERASGLHIDASTPEEAKLQRAKDNLADEVAKLQQTTFSEFARELVRAGFLASFRAMQASVIGNTGSFALETVAKIPAELIDTMASKVTHQRSIARNDVRRTIARMGKAPAHVLESVRDFTASLTRVGSNPTKSGYGDDRAIDYKPFNSPVLNAPLRGASWYINKVYGLIEAADAPARKQVFAQALWENAILDGINSGISPRDRKALAEHAERLIGSHDPTLVTSSFLDTVEDKPLKQVYLAAKQAEDEAVFANTSPATTIASQVSKIPVAGVLFLPFPKIPTNVVGRALEWSPLGFLHGAGKLVAAASASKSGGDPTNVKRLQRQGSLAVGRSMTSAGMFALGYFLKQMAPDEITEPAPTDPDERESMRAKGRQGSSIMIGGEWFSLRDVPQLTPFFAGALLAESKRVSGGGAGAAEYVQSSARGAARTAMDTPVLQGVDAARKFLDQSERGKPLAETTVAKQVGGSVVPAFVTDATSDGTKKVTNSPVERFMADIGGQGLATQVDAFGEKVRYNTGLKGQVRGLSANASFRSDPVRVEADSIGVKLDSVTRKPGEPARDYQKRATRAGQLFYESAKFLIESDWYKSATKDEKIAEWKKIKSQSREVATKESSLTRNQP